MPAKSTNKDSKDPSPKTQALLIVPLLLSYVGKSQYWAGPYFSVCISGIELYQTTVFLIFKVFYSILKNHTTLCKRA